MAFSKHVLDAIDKLAKKENIEKAALRAVVEVESSGRAFSTVNGRDMPLILYEYHIFYRYPDLTSSQRALAVKRRLAASKQGVIPYPNSQSARYNLLKRAADINEQAAYAACSWGVGQVLGTNAKWLGYGTPKKLAEKTISGIDGQLDVMMSFIKKRPCFEELKNRDWAGFARLYNGKGNVPVYSARMASAYKRHKGKVSSASDDISLRIGMTGEDVAELQRKLRGLGFHLIVDGDFGPATKRMVEEFQREFGLKVDGIADPETLSRIEALSPM